jgi:hypothetical protein
MRPYKGNYVMLPKDPETNDGIMGHVLAMAGACAGVAPSETACSRSKR